MSLQLICDYESDGEGETNNDDDVLPEEMETEDQHNPTFSNIDDIVLDVVNSLLNKVERHFSHDYSNYRNQHLNEESDSESSISEVWSLPDSDNDDDYCASHEDSMSQIDLCATKGELLLQDLPPIEKLQITVQVNKLVQVGIVISIVNPLVIIQSFKNLPVLDLDSVLFSKDGSSLGKIFDVIGPVRLPNYILRFNSLDEIKEYKLEMNSPVYYAEGYEQPITKYVFVKALETEKGSDASWKFDNEPPPEELDFSDDEAEKNSKWKRRAKSRRR